LTLVVSQAGYNTFTMANGNIAMTIKEGRIVSVYDRAHEWDDFLLKLMTLTQQERTHSRRSDGRNGDHGRSPKLLGVSLQLHHSPPG
jgi:ribosomal protein L17